MNKNIVAIIPARGGSKGIPKKNIIDLAGNPLIYYSIIEALNSKYISKVIVSTDDEEIISVVKNYNVDIIKRPLELAQDDTPTLPVLKHSIHQIEKEENIDIVVLLQPTSPLRKSKHIDSAIEKLINSNCDSVVSVCELQHSLATLVSIKNEKLKFNPLNLEKLRRQDSNFYRINGAVYVVKKEVLMIQEKYVLGEDTKFILMSKEESIDIDDYLDLILAEYYLRREEGESNGN